MLRPQIIGVVLILAFGGYSCKKKEPPKETVGIEVQPNNNNLGLFTSDTFTIVSTTSRLDSVRTDGNKSSTLGSYVDPVFGKVNAGFATQIRLSSENIDASDLADLKIDSVILNMAYVGRYGDATPQNFEVYEISEDLFTDSSYYSNHRLKYNSNKIGSVTNFAPTPTRPRAKDNTLENLSLRIPLDTVFGYKLFRASPSIYASNTAFLEFMKGLYVKANNPTQSSKTGGLVYFDLNDAYSRLIIYYKEQDGSANQLEYLINDKGVSFNLSDIEYQGTSVENAFDDKVLGSQTIYLQSFGGTLGKIETPGIQSIVKNGPVIVNFAQLQFSCDPTDANIYPVLPKLVLFGQNDSKQLYPLPDAGEVHFDGNVDADLNYKIGITRYIQWVLDGKVKNNGLLLMELGGIGARSVIYGPGSSKNKMKLIISYTPISSEKKN